MIALWMLSASCVSALLAAAALALDVVAEARCWPRRWIWIAALCAAVLVPAVAAVRSSGGTQASRAQLRPAVRPAGGQGLLVLRRGTAGSTSLQTLAQVLRPLDRTLLTVWAVAACVALGLCGFGAGSIARQRRLWSNQTVDGEAVLVAASAGPAVVGALRPQIVIPRWALALAPGDRALMLAHEREHVRASDPLLLQLSLIAGALVPWNIGLLWMVRRLRLAVEVDCDSRVLARIPDAKAYGALLLSVASRRTSTLLFAAPALFERRSSLHRRFAAMFPHRPRHPRFSTALYSAAAALFVAVACEVPSPEVLAPDGNDVASRRIYSARVAAPDAAGRSIDEVVAEHFPDVLERDLGPLVLFVALDASGRVVLTERQSASLPRKMRRDSGSTAASHPSPSVTRARVPATLPESSVEVARSPLDDLSPNDIATVDVSKHAAGKFGPSPVSVVRVVLKPGAKLRE